MKRKLLMRKLLVFAAALCTSALLVTSCGDILDEILKDVEEEEENVDSEENNNNSDENQDVNNDENQSDNPADDNSVKIIRFDSQWTTLSWTPEEDWSRMTIELDELPQRYFHVSLVTDLWEGPEDWYYKQYFMGIGAKTMEIDIATIFENELKGLTKSPDSEGYKEGLNLVCTKLVSIMIQNCYDGKNYLKLKSVTITKLDGSKEVLPLPEPDGWSIIDESEIEDFPDDPINNPEEDNKENVLEGYDENDVKNIEIYSQWNTISWNAEDDWSKLSIEFEENPGEVSFCVVSDLWRGPENWSYLTSYHYLGVGKTINLDLDAIYNKEFKGQTTSSSAEGYKNGYNLTCSKIDRITIQNYKAGSNTIKFIKAVVTKRDGSQEVLPLYKSDAWQIVSVEKPAQPIEDETSDDEIQGENKPLQVSYTQQYAAIKYEIPEGAVKFNVELEENAGAIGLIIASDATYQESWGDAQVSTYADFVYNKGVVSIDDELYSKLQEATKNYTLKTELTRASHILIQTGAEYYMPTIKVLKAYFTLADGTKQYANAYYDGWGLNMTEL